MAKINLNKLDLEFKNRVAEQPGGEGLKACFSCKACTAVCPIQPLDKRYDPRKIIRMVLLGMKEQVLGSDFIWLCSSCYSCQEVCPQNVRFTEVMYAIKNLAAQEACIPPGLTAQRSLLRKHGRLYEVGEFENEKRLKFGLPPIIEHPEDFEKLLPDQPVNARLFNTTDV
ncbi:MAG: 4Fe-4S dicluster domain-containing protein [Desulfomonilaceae bacterium]